ncbi:MAG: glucosamine-6-phosphate deaminase [Lewinellaceae bacterium]|nr:glucosamine-6-phosphate deaminase [Saprospiraceae bacterium]MCB9317594.1 glucosamine-6-phosphate deaminase [Lewinellaceae bacterium]MCB9332932.1 glucosamine-6-phosphate deaminase [Lewinellaceae bacterium]
MNIHLAFTSENTRFEKIPTRIFDTSVDASITVAREIADLIRAKARKKEQCVLGLATGSTPTSVYGELVRLHQEEGLSFQNVVTFNLDEYYPMQPNALQSYVRFMQEYLFDHVDILPENVHIPDGTVPKEKVAEFCAAYEAKIEAVGGLDLQILGIGRTGHIGFNEPGSGQQSRTRLITLDHITITDAASDFFGEENVPRKAITMGVGTILAARKVILMAWGEGKAAIIREAVEGAVSDHVPATYLQNHADATVILDRASAAELTRVKTPWLLGGIPWDHMLIKKAVIWLAMKLETPILKLTNRDYMDHGMGDIITEFDSAYNINIRVFNELQRTITGWPGGKPDADDSTRPERADPAQKRCIIFSPHPDDDVISMGGTFIRLVDQGHEVHVAYQTSGNIAVFDDDVVRFVDFVNDFHKAFDLEKTVTSMMFDAVKRKVQEKQPGEVDAAEVQRIKGLIRRTEAKAGCRYVGIDDSRAHFLDLPFYETGKVKKKPLGEEDIRITIDLLNAIQPHQIYAAGDLSDPHGTHRVCLEAIFRAVEQLKQENTPWLKDCYIWLYRGAWQEWEIENVDMAVPLSPEELLRKRRAIFKHQSQKDRPLFPGHDSREFWQRAESRNSGTARLYDMLGLPEYEAIEAFKRYYF